MITARGTQRQLLLRPDALANQIYLYTLGLAMQEYEVDLTQRRARPRPARARHARRR